MMLLVVSHYAHSKEIAGWVEKVTIHPGNLQLKAKIDSGAKTSSLHCECQQLLDKDGERWVSFVVTNYDGDQVHIERKVERTVKIKRHFDETQERVVVKLGVCLADIYKEIEVNIIDRSGLNYQMLIGRNFLAGDFLIDSQATFVNKPKCNKE